MIKVLIAIRHQYQREEKIIEDIFVKTWQKVVGRSHRMDKRESFVIARQYRNCFSRGINVLVPRNEPVKTAIGIVMHDFYGLKAMSFHCVSDIAYLLLEVTEIIQFFLQSTVCMRPVLNHN